MWEQLGARGSLIVVVLWQVAWLIHALLCCADNQVSDSEAAMALINQKLEHNKRMLCTLPLFLYIWHT